MPIFVFGQGLTIGAWLNSGSFLFMPINDAEIRWRLSQRDPQGLRDIARKYGEELVILAFAELSNAEAAGDIIEKTILQIAKIPWIVGPGDLRLELRKLVIAACKGQ